MAKYKDLSDRELTDLLNNNDEAAYEEIYARHWSSLYQSAYNFLRDRSGCQDVLQEIFVWLWEHRGRLEIKQLKGYLLAPVKYKTANYIRRGKASRRLFTEIEATDLGELPFYDDSMEVRELKHIIA